MLLAFLGHKQPRSRSAAPAKAVLVYGEGVPGVGSNVIGYGDAGQQ